MGFSLINVCFVTHILSLNPWTFFILIGCCNYYDNLSFKKIVFIDVEQKKQLSRAKHLNQDSLAIIYSPRGQSFIFSSVSSILMKNETKTILITQNENITNKSRYDKIINIGGINENNLGLISYCYFIDQFVLIYYNLYHDDLIV